MTTVLAVIDGSGASVAVLGVGMGISNVLNGRFEVLHVDTGMPLRALFHTQGLHAPLTIAHGDAATEIVRAAKRADVAIVVTALRNRVIAHRPIGATARAVIDAAPKGLVVVPPIVAPWPNHPRPLVLVPVGDEVMASPGESEALAMLVQAGSEVVMTRVDGHDHRVDEIPDIPQATATETPTPRWAAMMSGAIVAAADETRSDLIAFDWSAPTDPTAGVVVRSVLAASKTPVLLAPTPRRRPVTL